MTYLSMSDPTIVRRSIRLLLCLCLSAAVACAPSRQHGESQEGGQPAAVLPTLPPPSELDPDLYDENGCAIIDDKTVSCPASPIPIQTPPDTDPSVWRSLLGFQGPYYDISLAEDAPVVIESSITESTSGGWKAMGLVSNQTANPTGIELSATLFDSKGSIIDIVITRAMVEVIRSGEPAPFFIQSETVDAQEVHQVRWAASRVPVGETSMREFQVLQFWSLPYGDRERYSELYQDPPAGPPYPYVLEGRADNISAGVGYRPQVVAAWLDRDMRVIWIEAVHVGDVPNNPDGSQSLPKDLEPHAPGYFYLVVTNPTAAKAITAGDATPMLWVSARIES